MTSMGPPIASPPASKQAANRPDSLPAEPGEGLISLTSWRRAWRAPRRRERPRPWRERRLWRRRPARRRRRRLRRGGGARASLPAMTVGGTMVTTVRSALAPTGLQPSGSLRSETCTESWKSRPVRSIVSDSGMLSAGAITSTCVQHEVDRAALLQARRGLAVLDVDRHADAHARARRSGRRKSTCTGRSVTTSSW